MASKRERASLLYATRYEPYALISPLATFHILRLTLH